MNYDENINENIFFKQLKSNFGHLIDKATDQKWIICVPKNYSYSENFIEDDFKDHILIQNGGHYETINGSEVVVKNGNIIIKNVDCNKKKCLSVKILFEETFYTDNLIKSYKIWCVESFLNNKNGANSNFIPVVTSHDCEIFLSQFFEKNNLFPKLNDEINLYLQKNKLDNFFNVQQLKNAIKTLFDICIKMASTDSVSELINNGFNNSKLNFNISVETFMQKIIYKQLFDCILTNSAVEDSNFNKIIKNLSEIQVRHFEIKPEVIDSIPNSKQNLAKINNYTTFLDKINCIRSAFSEINTIATSDELLSVFVFLILKSNIPNWVSNFVFLKEFKFTKYYGDEDFLVSTLEAALEYIKSGIKFKKIETGSPLFDFIITGNDLSLTVLLEKMKKIDICENKSEKLCHPLCSCDNCEVILNKSAQVPNILMINDRGMTCLHFACQYGRPEVVQILLKFNSDENLIDKKDFSGATPLHYASLRGYQDIFLLLLDHGAKINVVDNEKNSPLHFACLGGHLGIVKAILFNYINKTDINGTNFVGDTGLHYASRWGYIEIVQLLLEHNAKTNLKNRLGKTPLNYALNPKILKLFHQDHTNNKNFDFVSIENEMVKTVQSPRELKKAELLLRAVTYNDIPLICFYLGISLLGTHQNLCHPLCTCQKCSKNVSNPEKIDINSCNSEGYTPLHMASLHGQLDIVNLLLANQAGVNVTTSKGQTPLHLACQTDRFDIVNILLSNNDCKVNVQDLKGNTPLHLACNARNLDIVKSLVENGADFDIMNFNGKSPLDECEGEILEFLKNKMKKK